MQVTLQRTHRNSPIYKYTYIIQAIANVTINTSKLTYNIYYTYIIFYHIVYKRYVTFVTLNASKLAIGKGNPGSFIWTLVCVRVCNIYICMCRLDCQCVKMYDTCIWCMYIFPLSGVVVYSCWKGTKLTIYTGEFNQSYRIIHWSHRSNSLHFRFHFSMNLITWCLRYTYHACNKT